MAAEDFDRILNRHGIGKACEFSEIAEKKAETLDQTLYAIAFDFAAMTVDKGVAGATGTTPTNRFVPDAVLVRAKRRLSAVGFPQSGTDDLLADVLKTVRASLAVVIACRRKK